MPVTIVEMNVSIRKDDQVAVIAGREKGKTGKVLSVDAKAGRVKIEKLNLVKRHVKPNQKNPQGGVLEQESSIHYSNVQLLCPKCNRGVRHGHKFVEKSAGGAKKGAKKAEGAGKEMMKVRVCKRCETVLDVAK
jgi:large subunit ribosomal protein L24